MFSKVVSDDKLDNDKNDIVNLLESCLPRRDGNTVIDIDGCVALTSQVNSVLFDLMKNSDGLTPQIIGMILDASYRSEKISGSSASLTTKTLVRLLSEEMNHINDEIFKKYISRLSKFPSFQDLESCLLSTIRDREISNIITEMYRTFGIETKIFVDPAPSTFPEIELSDGYIFDNLILPIGPFSGERPWEFKWAKTIAIAADHAGYELKGVLKGELEGNGYTVLDLGTDSADSVDYPDFAARLANAIESGQAERGVLVCGTGIGMSIAANRHRAVRAALCHDMSSARLAREHNDANVLAMGARLVGGQVAIDCLRTFLATAFAGGRHRRRVAKMS